MHFIPIKVTVPNAATVVNLATIITNMNLPADVLPNGRCHAIKLWPKTTNTGIVYVGLIATARGGPGIAMVGSTGVGVLKEVYPPAAAGYPDEFCQDSGATENGLNPNDFAFDTSVNGSVLIGHLQVN